MKNKLKENSAVLFWCFVFVVITSVINLNQAAWSGSGVRLLFNGGNFISFFLFLFGYLLMKYYQEHKTNNEKSTVEAWKYTKKKISYFYPALLGGVALSFIFRNFISGTNLFEMCSQFMNSLLEFFGLSQIGFATGANITLWNEPLWIIPTIIVSTFILYFIINKNEDLFNLIAVILIVFSFGNASNGLLYVSSLMSIGMLLYYLVNYFQNKKLGETSLMILSFTHIAIIMLLIYCGINGVVWNNSVIDLLLFLFLFILLLNKDYISVLYNDSGFFNFLGRISIYYFACHIAFVYLLNYLFPNMDYYASVIFTILFSFCWSFIMFYFDEYVITPIFRKEKEVKKTRKKIASK